MSPLFGCLLTVLAAAGCIGGQTVSEVDSTSTHIGRLRTGQEESGDHLPCEWLETETGARLQVIYPDGWDVLFEPTRVLDDSGNVVAIDGDLIRVTGVIGDVGSSLCFEGPIIAADQFEVVAP